MRYALKQLALYWRLFGRRGLWLAFKARLSRRPFEIEIRVAGIAHPLRVRLKTSDLPAYQGVFINREYDLPLRMSPTTIIDAGANVGFASIFFANKYPHARVIAIEPEASNFELLKRNVEPYPNITPLRAALWKDDVIIDLVDPGIGHWGFQATKLAWTDQKTRLGTVQGVTVERIMRDYALDYVDILKMDIEGAERDVLENPSPWIDNVGVVIAELHDRYGIGCCRNFYRATQGFDVELQKGELVFMLREKYSLT
jgi:FkbM family methyltransferase